MRIQYLCVPLLLGWLAACVSVPADRGSKQSVALVQERSTVATDLQLQAVMNPHEPPLTSQLLDADAAVRVALVNSPRMQGLYAQLGLAQADVYDASRLSNPSLGFIRLTSAAGTRKTWTLTQSFTELLFLHYRRQGGRSQLLQAQQRVAQEVLNLEAQVRIGYYRQVGATLVAQLHEQAALAAQASAEYAQTLFNAGNISELQLSREQVAVSEARVAAQTASGEALRFRGELLTLLGLPLTNSKIEFVERLVLPVTPLPDRASLQRLSEQRVDLLNLQEQLKLYDAVRIHARRWFWLDNVQLQAERENDTDGNRLSGGGASVGVPLFNQGGGARLRAQAQWEIVQTELRTKQLQISNELDVQLSVLQQAQAAVEEYRLRLMPLRERILALTQQQHNYMLVGTFDLLNAKGEVLRGYQDYLQATSEYWIKQVELSKTVGGRLPDSVGADGVGADNTGSTVGVDALPPLADHAAMKMENLP